MAEDVPEATNDVLLMTVTLVIAAEHREEYLAELREVLPQARSEPACVYLNVGEVSGRPGTFVLSERWRDAHEYVNQILQKPYFRRYVDRTERLYERPRTVLVLTPVAP